MDMSWVRGIFETGGQSMVREFQRLMNSQMGVNGVPYSPLKPETIQQKMKISAQTAPKRMLRTKDFWNRAFQYAVGLDGLVVYINKDLHGRELLRAKNIATRAKLRQKKMGRGPGTSETFENIAYWQLESGDSQFFPETMDQVRNLNSFRQMARDFKVEALKQIRAQGTIRLKQEVRLG